MHMHPKLQMIIELAETMQTLNAEDSSIVICDTKEVVYNLPGKTFTLGLVPPIPLTNFKDMLPDLVLRKRMRLTEELPREVFGISITSVGIPVFDEQKKVIGIVIASQSLEKMASLKQSSSEIISLVEEMSDTTNEIASGSSEISDQLAKVTAAIQAMKTDIQQIEKTLLFVQDVSNQSNLLGLNASIEAARAGEFGKGFSIVAGEIRKMSDQSKDAARSSKEQLTIIQKSFEDVNGAVTQVANITKRHHAGLEELKQSFGQIVKMAERIK